MNITILKYILPLFLGWRLALTFITYFGLSLFPHTDPVKNLLFFPSPDIEYWIRWANWDGGHYRGIAENGYIPIQTVFFPAYPLLIKGLMLLGFSSLWAGLLISHLSVLVAFYFLYQLVLLDFSSKIAKRTIFALLIFPTSFYLAAVYNESFFLAVAVAAIYFARTGRWWLATLFAGLAGITKLVGLAVIIAVFFEYVGNNAHFSLSTIFQTRIRRLLVSTALSSLFLRQTDNMLVNFKSWFWAGLIGSVSEIITRLGFILLLLTFGEWLTRNISLKEIFSPRFLILSFSILPFTLYLVYQQIIFQDFLNFIDQEALWHKSLSYPWDGAILYYEALKIRGLFQIGDPARVLIEFSLFIFLVLGFVISLCKLRLSYNIYYLFALGIPLLSGTLLDLPRYTLSIFPVFMLLGKINNELAQQIGTLFFTLLLSALSILYINSYWFL